MNRHIFTFILMRKFILKNRRFSTTSSPQNNNKKMDGISERQLRGALGSAFVTIKKYLFHSSQILENATFSRDLWFDSFTTIQQSSLNCNLLAISEVNYF